MNALDLLTDLRSRGVHLSPSGDRLRYRAPRGVLTDELLGQLRDHKAELLEELRRSTPSQPDLAEAPIVATREQISAVLLRTPYFDLDVWLALDSGMAAQLRAEEAQRSDPRPVLETQDIVELEGKSKAAIRASLKVYTIFPGSRLVQ